MRDVLFNSCGLIGYGVKEAFFDGGENRSNSGMGDFFPVPFTLPKTSEEHPHGLYADADYHRHPRPNKSPAPKDGQEALDNSVPVKNKDGTDSKRRVGVSDGEFVVLCPTLDGEWHGHVRPWDGGEGERLTPSMKKALEKAGMANVRGRPQPSESWNIWGIL